MIPWLPCFWPVVGKQKMIVGNVQWSIPWQLGVGEAEDRYHISPLETCFLELGPTSYQPCQFLMAHSDVNLSMDWNMRNH